MTRSADGANARPLRRWRASSVPWPVAALVLVLLQLTAGFYLLRLHVNNAPEAYYPPDSPGIQLRDALRREFPSDEVLTLVFRGTAIYGHDFLSRLDKFRQQVEREPLVDRVFTVTSTEQIRGSDDGFAVGLLVDLKQVAGSSAQETRSRVLADRFAPGLLASRDGRYMAVAVRPKPLTDSTQRRTLRTAVMASLDANGLREFYVGDAGPLTLDVVQLESMLADTAVFVPMTVSIGMALMWWLVGAVRPVVFGAIAMSSVVGPTVAMIPAFDAPYTMVAAILPSLLSAYTMATLMHVYAAMQRAQAAGNDNSTSIDLALTETRKPGALNVLTTGAGLLSLLLVPIPPIQVFGAVGALGTALVFIVVFLLMPPLMRRWDWRPWPQRDCGMNRLGRLSATLTVFSMRHPRWMVLGAIALIALSVPVVREVKVESNLLSYFRHDHPVNEVTRVVDSRFSGVTVLEISLLGSGRDSLQDIATLKAVREFQAWLEALPQVDRTLSMVDLVEEMHWAMNGEKPGLRVIPADNKLLKQYLLVYDGRDLYELVNREYQRARILVNLNVHAAQEIATVIESVREHSVRNQIPGVQVEIGGHGRLFADQAQLLVDGQLRSFIAAFLQIFVLMAVIWRSLRAATVCMAPNLAPLFFVFVLMGAVGISLDMATVMIASLVIGITVDDTIHLFHGFRERLAQGLCPVFAIARTFRASGRAVLATSVLLVSQFALLGCSSFVPTANFGQLTAVGLIAGQAFELLLLPALLVLATRRGTQWRKPRANKKAAVGDTSRFAETVPNEAGAAGAGVVAPAIAPTLTAAPVTANHVLFCLGRACRERGAVELWRQAKLAERLRLVDEKSPVLLIKTDCLGRCSDGPVVMTCVDAFHHTHVDTHAAAAIVKRAAVTYRRANRFAVVASRAKEERQHDMLATGDS